MKLKPTFLLATFVVALGLLLGTSAAQAQTVICENDPAPCAEGESVIRIENLEVFNIYLNVAMVYNLFSFFDTRTVV